jgi:hypothetical protein
MPTFRRNQIDIINEVSDWDVNSDISSDSDENTLLE